MNTHIYELCGVLGNSGEYKNCILLDGVQTPHYNYIGDSVLGNKAHTGAGAVCSNLKSDGKPVVIHGEEDIQTGLRKIGGILGDGADVGCGCVLNPGTVIGKHTSLTALRGVYPANAIVKGQKDVVLQEQTSKHTLRWCAGFFIRFFGIPGGHSPKLPKLLGKMGSRSIAQLCGNFSRGHFGMGKHLLCGGSCIDMYPVVNRGRYHSKTLRSIQGNHNTGMGLCCDMAHGGQKIDRVMKMQEGIAGKTAGAFNAKTGAFTPTVPNIAGTTLTFFC